MLTESKLDSLGTDMLSFSLGEDSRNFRQFADLYDRGNRWPSQLARKDYIVHCCYVIARTMLKFRRCKNIILWEEVANAVSDILSWDSLNEEHLFALMERVHYMEQNWELELSKRLLSHDTIVMS